MDDLSARIKLHEAYFRDRTQGERLVLENVDLRGADLSSARLQRISLKNVDLSGANLTGACLHHAELEEVTLSSACLRGAEFADAQLNKVDFRGADLQGADLSHGIRSHCDFSDANLFRAVLAKSSWRDVVMTGANLQECNLTRWRVVGADLRKVDFTGSDLTEVGWERVDAREACFAGIALYGTAFGDVRAWGVHGKPLMVDDIVAESDLDLSEAGDGSKSVSGAQVVEFLNSLQ